MNSGGPRAAAAATAGAAVMAAPAATGAAVVMGAAVPRRAAAETAASSPFRRSLDPVQVMVSVDPDVHARMLAAALAPADDPDKHGGSSGADERAAAVALTGILALGEAAQIVTDRKSTRLNFSHIPLSRP